MKKSLIAVAVAALPVVGFAQTSVSIYGIIDQSYTTGSTTASLLGDSAKVKFTDTGNQSGLATQRLGFKGTEDLGGGLKGLFQVENALSAGNAGTNGFGSRPTFVGLSGNFGTLTLGRQDTPLLKAVVPQLSGSANNTAGQLMWSPFLSSGDLLVANAAGSSTSAQLAAAAGAAAIADAGLGRMARQTTIDRAINYVSPTINGFQSELQVGKSDFRLTESGSTDTVNIVTDDFGLNLRYAEGPLTLAAATHNQKATRDGLNAGKNTNNYVGATYDLGMAIFSLQHAQSKRSVNNDRIYTNKGTQLGVKAPLVGAWSAFGSYGFGSRNADPAPNEAKFKQDFYQLGLTYGFSKRTVAYAIYGNQQLKGDNALTDGFKLKDSQLALGVSHSF